MRDRNAIQTSQLCVGILRLFYLKMGLWSGRDSSNLNLPFAAINRFGFVQKLSPVRVK